MRSCALLALHDSWFSSVLWPDLMDALLPVISVAALVKMTKLTEESDVDNVLLEWLIMVELQAKV